MKKIYRFTAIVLSIALLIPSMIIAFPANASSPQSANMVLVDSILDGNRNWVLDTLLEGDLSTNPHALAAGYSLDTTIMDYRINYYNGKSADGELSAYEKWSSNTFRMMVDTVMRHYSLLDSFDAGNTDQAVLNNTIADYTNNISRDEAVYIIQDTLDLDPASFVNEMDARGIGDTLTATEMTDIYNAVYGGNYFSDIIEWLWKQLGYTPTRDSYEALLSKVFTEDYTSSSGVTFNEGNALTRQFQQTQKIFDMMSSISSSIKGASELYDSLYGRELTEYERSFFANIDEEYYNKHILSTEEYLGNIKKVTGLLDSAGNNAAVEKVKAIEGICLHFATSAGYASYDLFNHSLPSLKTDGDIKKYDDSIREMCRNYYKDYFENEATWLDNIDITEMSSAAMEQYILLAALCDEQNSTLATLNRLSEQTSDPILISVINDFSNDVESEFSVVISSVEPFGDYFSDMLKNGVTKSIKEKIANSPYKNIYSSITSVLNTVEIIDDSAIGMKNTVMKTCELLYLQSILEDAVKMTEKDIAAYRADPTDEGASRIINDIELLRRLRLRGETIAYKMVDKQMNTWIGLILGCEEASDGWADIYQDSVDAFIGASPYPISDTEFTVGKDEILTLTVDENGSITGTLDNGTKMVSMAEMEYRLMGGLVINGGTVYVNGSASLAFIPDVTISNNGKLYSFIDELEISSLSLSETVGTADGKNGGTIRVVDELIVKGAQLNGTVYLSGNMTATSLIKSNAEIENLIIDGSKDQTITSTNAYINDLAFDKPAFSKATISGTLYVSQSLENPSSVIENGQKIILQNTASLTYHYCFSSLTVEDYNFTEPITFNANLYLKGTTEINNDVTVKGSLKYYSGSEVLNVADASTLSVEEDFVFLNANLNIEGTLKTYGDIVLTKSTLTANNLILCGKAGQDFAGYKQNVDKNTISVANLTFSNDSIEGINVLETVNVTGKYINNASLVENSENLSLPENASSIQNVANGDATFNNSNTAENIIPISSAAELLQISSDRSASYVLTCDIDMSGIDNFEPIGNAVEGPFTGNFDGAGHSILNLHLFEEGRKYAGLFGYIEGSVHDVNLVDTAITGGRYIGGVAAYCGENGSVINCSISGTILSERSVLDAEVGGICGYNSGAVANCTNSTDISAKKSSKEDILYIGGIIGVLDSNVPVDNCVNNGNITIKDQEDIVYSAGIVAYAKNTAVISNAVNKGTIYNYISEDVWISGTTPESTYYSSGIIARSYSAEISDTVNYGDVICEDKHTTGSSQSFFSSGILTYFTGKNLRIHRTANFGNIIADCSLTRSVSEVAVSGGIVGYLSGAAYNEVSIEINQSCNYGYIFANAHTSYANAAGFVPKVQAAGIVVVMRNTNGAYLHTKATDCINYGQVTALSSFQQGKYMKYYPWGCSSGLIVFDQYGTSTSTNEGSLDVNNCCNTGVVETFAYSEEINNGFKPGFSTAERQWTSPITSLAPTSINNCFYSNNNLSFYRNFINHGSPLSDEQLLNQSNYAGWNFENVWYMDPSVNDGLPILRWLYEKRDLLRISELQKTIEQNQSFSLVAYVGDSIANNVTWTSSDETIAIVDTTGKVFTHNVDGRTVITATTEDGRSVSCSVYVISQNNDLSLSDQIVDVGNTITLSPDNQIVDFQKIADYVVKWESSNPSVVSIGQADLSTECKITGLRSGKAVITGTTVHGRTLSCMVTVKAPATEIQFENPTTTIGIGQSKTLDYILTPADCYDTVTFASDNMECVSVDTSTGEITGINVGTAIISATTSSGQICYCTVTCETASITDIYVSQPPAKVNYNPGDTLITDGLEITLDYNDGTSETVLSGYSCSPTTFTSEGTHTVIVTYDGFTASFEVTCTAYFPATDIRLSKNELEISRGSSTSLTAEVTPSNSTDAIVWNSSDPSIATVTDGVVTAVSAGHAVITATAGDVSAECEVTVVVSLIEISADKDEYVTDIGKEITPTITFSPADATNKLVTFSSSDETVAIIENGTIKTLSDGCTTITATAEDGSHTAVIEITVIDSSKLDKVNIEANNTNDIELPDTISVTLPNGSAVELPVVWDSVPDNLPSSTTSFDINGTIDGLDNKITCTITISSDDICRFVVNALFSGNNENGAPATITLLSETNPENAIEIVRSSENGGSAEVTALVGNYILRVTKLGHTSYIDKTFTVEKDTSLNTITLYAGDINGDGVINAKDQAAMTETFGSNQKESDFNAAADFNEDGFINAKDRADIVVNFGKSDTVIE